MTRPSRSGSGPFPGWFVGEFVGTFLVVLFGCGSVCAAVSTGAQVGVFQVAIVWGLGIALAVCLTGALSGAHLNPAVTVALAAWGGFPGRRVMPYIATQMLGAFVAAGVLHLVFSEALADYEASHGLIRGLPGSEATAMVYAEYFPNPGGKPLTEAARARMSAPAAFGAEVLGSAVLMLVILGVTDTRNGSRPDGMAGWAIGLTVTVLISILGPLTMACFNPARDLAPRVFSSLAGWGMVPFRVNGLGWLTVYVLAPILGAWLGGMVHHRILAPAYPRIPD